MAIPYNHRRTAGSGEGEILYHGSPATIPIGEVVRPNKGEASATPDIDKARAYAEGFFGGGKGTIHRVEPFESDTTLYTPSKKPNEVRSRQGFKVVGHE